MKKFWLLLILFCSLGFISYTFAGQSNTKIKVGIDEKLGGKIPLSLRFYNSDGDTLSLGQIIDKPTIISLVYFNCSGICNPLTAALTDAMEHIQMNPGVDFKVITISFDHNDKIADAKKWKRNYLGQMTRKFPDKSWYFLVGDSASILALTNSLGFYFKEDGYKNFIHTGSIYAISPTGMISRYLYFDKYYNPFDIKMALLEAGEGKTNPTISKVLQYCFSYDPHGKTYVFNFTKVIGTFMLLAVAILFLVLVLKGKKKQEIKSMEDGNDK